MQTFAGTRILEIAEGTAGPTCGLYFADLGATVIKVEPPHGDRAREWGPPASARGSAIFSHLNRGKLSVVLDLAVARDRRRLEALVPAADAVIVHLDPAQRSECGIDWREVSARHPHLVVCEIDDLGDAGPLGGLSGSELVMQAMSGFTRYLGEPGAPPCRIGFEVAWMAAGMHAFQAVAIGLWRRAKTGTGQFVRVGGLKSLLSLKSILLAAQSEPDEWKGFHVLGPHWPPDYGWPTRDGQVTLDFRHHQRDAWAAFCRKIGLGDLPGHPDYEDWRSTIYIGDRRHRYGEAYRTAFAAMSSQEASDLVNECGGISVKFQDYAEMLAHPQVEALAPLVETADAAAPRQVGMPFRCSGHASPARFDAAPGLGADSPRVLLDGAPAAGAKNKRREPVPAAGCGPLGGLKVLDASMGAVGPWAGALLGQLGADVVKLESPEGDFIRNNMPAQRGMSTTYISMNLNKRGIVLNLKDGGARRHAHELAAKADIFLENFRPEVAERLGLGYDELSRLNPRLIYASATGFGRAGPMAAIGATDPHIQAFSGSTSVNGAADRLRERLRCYALFDCVTSLCLVQGIATALYARESTGRGQRVDVTMLEAALALQRMRIAEHLAGGEPKPMGSATTYLVPDQAFGTQDRHIAVSATNEGQWRACCRAIGRPGLAGDPRFCTNPLRIAHRGELIPQLEAIFVTRPSAYWLQVLRAAQVPCSTFSSFSEFRYHAHYLANELLVTIDTPHWGKVTVGGVPWEFEGAPASIRAGPMPGEHTDEIINGHWPDLTS